MKNIFLIGFMGCGKSAVSSRMAKEHGMNIREMDEEIVKREGISISEIFETKGEAYFRSVETKLMIEISEMDNQIVSCGGGAVLREENVQAMKNSGVVVLLTAKAETILNRVKHDDNRPLLKGNKNVEFIQDMLDKRRPKYEAAADIVVETDDKKIYEICNEIIQKVKER